MRKLSLGVSLALSLLAVAAPSWAGDCYSVRVSGCGKKARICVATSSSSTAETRAVEAFKRAYNCSSASVSSYSSSCSEAANDRCDIRQKSPPRLLPRLGPRPKRARLPLALAPKGQ